MREIRLTCTLLTLISTLAHALLHPLVQHGSRILISNEASLRTARRNGCSALSMALDDSMMSRLENIRRSYMALTERLADPDVFADSNLLMKVMSDRSQSEEVVNTYETYKKLLDELEEAKVLFQDAGDDQELKEMAREEIKTIEPQLEDLEDKIKILLLPKDPNDNRNIMLEIRAGTGGSEASIFAGDLLDVYRKYINTLGWQASVIDSSAGDDGGYKNVVMEVKGDSVYSRMKWEAGVHRVQRVRFDLSTKSKQNEWSFTQCLFFCRFQRRNRRVVYTHPRPR